MKLILTSFGLSHLSREIEEKSSARESLIREAFDNEKNDIFYRMPPVSMSKVNEQFLPDYSSLLLTDKLIIDKETYNRLISDFHPSFNEVSIMIRALYDEGFIQIENFDEVIKENEILLKQMLERDLKEIDLWVNPLKDSINNWHTFIQMFDNELRKAVFKDIEKYQRGLHSPSIEYHIDYALHYNKAVLMDADYLIESLNSSTKRRKSEYRNILKKHLSEYLSYINSNLVLSHKFNAGFHDWNDFQPFYKEKFMRIGQESAPGRKELENVNKLFEISFPEFSNWQPKKVIKALKDKRINELRKLVDSATNGEVKFDKEFANRTLKEVFKIETEISKFRTIVSYATMPLGFIPIIGTPIQKIAEESIAQPVIHNKRKDFRWFYMISELTTNRKTGHNKL